MPNEDIEKDVEELVSKHERLKKLTEDLVKRYNKINRDSIRRDLASAIEAGSLAFEKMENEDVKEAARGLVHASIAKLHGEVDKL